MTLYKLSFQTTSKDAPLFGDALDENVLASSWYEIDEDTDHWVMDATLNDEMDQSLICQQIKDIATRHGIATPEIIIEELPDMDWLEQTWKNFPPRQIGRFFIYGSHTQIEIPDGLIGLEINAATAFGSGEHETTTACINALTKMYNDGYAIQNPLDMGCGSGILAMVIAKLWGIPVLAVDNDPESVRVTTTNAHMNDCSDLIHPLCNEGFAGTIVKEKGKFDLIAANILAAPLCEMAPDMSECTPAGGKVVLSGLLIRQIESVRKAYEEQGFTFIDQHLIGDWAALVFEK